MSDVRTWKVLIVEDEADAMEMVQGLLEYYGVSTWGVATAEAALEVLQDVHPTMIIIDLNLPGIDGWALLKCLRQNNSLMNIPRVAITAYYTVELAREAIAAGFDAFFPKPLNANVFLRDLQDLN